MTWNAESICNDATKMLIEAYSSPKTDLPIKYYSDESSRFMKWPKLFLSSLIKMIPPLFSHSTSISVPTHIVNSSSS